MKREELFHLRKKEIWCEAEKSKLSFEQDLLF
jgi:hypothetical protein